MKLLLYLFAFINSLFLAAEAAPLLVDSSSLSSQSYSSEKSDNDRRDKNTTKYSLDDFKEIPLDKPD